MLNHSISEKLENRETVILLHGLFGNLDNLAVIRRGLEKGFNVVSIDLPDHGKSPRTDTFSFANYANEVMALLDHLQLDTPHILGHSLGGKVAMYCAMHFPQRVKKLLVADIAPVSYQPRHQNVLNGLNAVDLQNTRDRQHANDQMAEHIEMPSVRQFLLKSFYREGENWAWRFNLPMLERDYGKLSVGMENEPVFRGKTLFVKGSESDYLTQEHRDLIQRLFPASQAHVIQGTGHWLHAEKPDAFNRVALKFFQSA